jgi:hypothetical protein
VPAQGRAYPQPPPRTPMPPQTKLFFDFWKISMEQGAQLQRRQLELMTAMQLRLAESQIHRTMDFWTRLWTGK